MLGFFCFSFSVGEKPPNGGVNLEIKKSYASVIDRCTESNSGFLREVFWESIVMQISIVLLISLLFSENI